MLKIATSQASSISSSVESVSKTWKRKIPCYQNALYSNSLHRLPGALKINAFKRIFNETNGTVFASIHVDVL